MEDNLSKRKPKGPIRFQIQLSEDQKEGKRIILENTITVLKGGPGSGKSALAVQVSLDMLFKREIEKIYIARPFVYAEREPLGILPGNVNEKLIGLTTPVLENMYLMYDKDKIDKLIEEGTIRILPISFMRGVTVSNSVLILDEFQNATISQIHTALTRLGKGTKIIVTGDMSQCDLPNKSMSGFDFFKKLEAENVKGVKIHTLKENHRHELVEVISKMYNDYIN